MAYSTATIDTNFTVVRKRKRSPDDAFPIDIYDIKGGAPKAEKWIVHDSNVVCVVKSSHHSDEKESKRYKREIGGDSSASMDEKVYAWYCEETEKYTAISKKALVQKMIDLNGFKDVSDEEIIAFQKKYKVYFCKRTPANKIAPLPSLHCIKLDPIPESME